MEIRDRIVLLDDLLLLSQHAQLSEQQIGGLLDFLADLPESERDAVIDYLLGGDHNRIERVAKIANMPDNERAKMLRAVGLSCSKRTVVDEFFTFLGGDNAGQKVREAAGDVATEAGRELSISFLETLRRFLSPYQSAPGRERVNRKER